VTLGDELAEAAIEGTPVPGSSIDPLRRVEMTTEPIEEERL
jgi:hypothetical protein